MTTSPQAFAVQMYEEHLEEASFLYEQHKALRNDPELPWTRLSDFEERLEAHLDALVIGGRLALEVCKQRAREGDAGELFAAVSVYCRNEDAGLLAETWRTLDYDDAAKTQSLTDALKYELPETWYPAILRAIERGYRRQVPLLARVCGYRRAPAGEQLLRRAAADDTICADVVWALARVPDNDAAEELLVKSCEHADPAVKCEAYCGLLRRGRRDALRACMSLASREVWPQIVLGLGGDRTAAETLRRRLESGTATAGTMIALGLLGDVTVVRSLTAALGSEEFGASAALALHWITGAPLFEKAFVPETPDEAALFDAELRAWRERQELPRRADGLPFGTTVHQLSRDPGAWHTWLAVNAARFDPSYRYRRGQLYSARALLLCLLDEAVPQHLRQLAYEELAIRFGCDVPFESDLPVREQTIALRAIGEWVAAREAQLDTGKW
jgi:uncharacterized protein (TIGR02270 family)